MKINFRIKPIMKYKGILLSMKNPIIKERFSHIRTRLGRTWEAKERKMILKYLPENQDYIELGGCIGFTSLTAKKYKNTKKHIIVEANPRLIGTIEENKKLLGFNDIIIINKAYTTTKKEEIEFTVSSTGIGSSSVFKKEGDVIKVKTTNLGEILNNYNIKRFNLMCDIEGSESELLTDEIGLLKEYCNILIIELHGNLNKLKEQLIKNSFKILDSSNGVYAFKNKRLINV